MVLKSEKISELRQKKVYFAKNGEVCFLFLKSQKIGFF